MSQTQGGVNEDSVSFVSAIFGALGSTVTQQSNPQTLLFGLVLSAFAKAVPSLGKNVRGKETVEDWLLLTAAFAGALAAGIQSNFTFSDPYSQRTLILALCLGLIGKAVPSIINGHGGKEDWVSLAAAVASFIAGLPLTSLAPQYAAVGVFFGFLAKQLIPPST